MGQFLKLIQTFQKQVAKIEIFSNHFFDNDYFLAIGACGSKKIEPTKLYYKYITSFTALMVRAALGKQTSTRVAA
jgi:hypothetical protein